MLCFNPDYGFADALVRSFRSALLTSSQYANLVQCESLEDFKVQLCATEYASLLANEPAAVSVDRLRDILNEMLVDEFNLVRNSATGKLAKFLEYVTFGYMIDNVVLLISGSILNASASAFADAASVASAAYETTESVSKSATGNPMYNASFRFESMLERCSPLGFFETLPALCAAESVDDVYSIVLATSPLGPYFKSCIELGLASSNSDINNNNNNNNNNNKINADTDRHRDTNTAGFGMGMNSSSSSSSSGKGGENRLSNINMEILRGLLNKLYLEDFLYFCQNEIGGPTGELMEEIIAFESDRRAINIAYNAIGTELTVKDKLKLFPRIGRLYPSVQKDMAMTNSVSALAAVLQTQPHADFQNLLAEGEVSFEEQMYTMEVAVNRRSFMDQFNFAVFFSYVKLKEQEIRNLVWIAECISQRRREEASKYISIE